MKRTNDYRSILGKDNPLKRFPKLCEAAADEFSAKTYADASLNEIIVRSGMSKGSLYHHFGGKFGLYLAVLDSAREEYGRSCTVGAENAGFVSEASFMYTNPRFYAIISKCRRGSVPDEVFGYFPGMSRSESELSERLRTVMLENLAFLVRGGNDVERLASAAEIIEKGF